ncbi:MAG TPA: GTP cyclohydrolase II [Anaerolineales bacterium]|jgi:GTP cyclohydrolase II
MTSSAQKEVPGRPGKDVNPEGDSTRKQKPRVKIAAIAELPTRYGMFHIIAFQNARDQKEHVAIVRGKTLNEQDMPVRLHSECLTGDVFGSLRCDCRDQLEGALKMIDSLGRGIVIYLRQEGRGIGLLNKIRAYNLQDQGLDTVEANLVLGFRDDERDYAVAAHMLQAMMVKSIQLITNNPKKIEQLSHYGVPVTGRIPHIMEPNEHNRFYLETKAAKSGHWIDFSGKAHVPEQFDRPIVLGMSEEQIRALGE